VIRSEFSCFYLQGRRVNMDTARRKLEDCNVETRQREKPQITEMLNSYLHMK